MSATRSTAEERARKYGAPASETRFPKAATAAMLAASLTVLIGLLLVYFAKTAADAQGTASLPARQPLDLNAPAGREPLLAVLAPLFPRPADREFAAEKIHERILASSLPNVGALARLTVSEREIAARPDLEGFAERLKERQATLSLEEPRKELSLPLLTPRQLGQLKPAVTVRSRSVFRWRLLFWAALYFAGFYLVIGVWRRKRFRGDEILLPAVHMLTGIGLVLMVSIRDPLRDRMDFVEFVQGVLLGCVVLLGMSFVDLDRLQRQVFLPLLAGLGLSLALILFGSGPTGSDARVNLLSTQPVEAIKVLIVIFLAAFFAARWDGLRALSERPGRLPFFLRLFEPPRLKDSLPVAAAMGIALLFFFLQKDLGPALVLACTFLALYTVARGRLLLSIFGLGMIATGFWAGYRLGFPRTVSQRIQIWLSPWDNAIGGGIQLVHSFWALATGELTGTGLGLGSPQIVPAVHTDLILAAAGEELGFIGLLVIFALYGLILWRGLRIALWAGSDYAAFLALGLICLTGFQIFLISGGMLGLVPLSGVVSPFLSFGKSSMIANLGIIGIFLAISARPAEDAQRRSRSHFFAPSIQGVGAVFAILFCLVLGKAGFLQVIRADRTLIAGTLTLQGDGRLRYQYNPRLESLARGLPKGSIYDRNGIPLATSSWEELEQHRAQYEKLGISIEEACSRQDERHYPFGGLSFHLLGDRRSRTNWAARNSAYLERDLAGRLVGYDDHAQTVEVRQLNGRMNLAVQRDYSELIPLLRYRYRPAHESVRRVLDRNRNVYTTIDIALQQRVAAILRDRITAARKERGAAVVMDAATGDLLAAVSYPFPTDGSADAGEYQFASDDDGTGERNADAVFDRARFGIYPPGSTFKIVTAIAALRKDPKAMTERFVCRSLDGRQGAIVRGRVVHDDESDGAVGHGAIDLEEGIVKSCNAYFAQLGVERVGAEALFQTAAQLELGFARTGAGTGLYEKFRDDLAQSAYGQGAVFVTPFQMARVAAGVANDGAMPYGRWVIDDSNPRTQAPMPLLPGVQARAIAKAMRGVVQRGTGRRLNGLPIEIAGKTGTAEHKKGAASHSWFIGFAPFNAASPHRFAFSVLVENGGYGGSLAAPIAGEVAVAAANSIRARTKR